MCVYILEMLCLHKALLKTKGEEEVAISTVAPERKRKPHIPHTTIPHFTSLRFALLLLVLPLGVAA